MRKQPPPLPKPSVPATPQPPPPRRRRRNVVVLLIGSVLLAILFFGIRYFIRARAYVSTDDAFIDAHVAALSPRVASYVSRVLIDDNQHVKPGDLLVELDPRDFEVALKQARADLAQARAEHHAAVINVTVVTKTTNANVDQATAAVQLSQRQIEAARHNLEEAQAEILAAEAESFRAGAEAMRYANLLLTGAVSRQEADNAVAANRTAVARLEAARQAEQAAAATVRQQTAQLGESRANLAEALAAPDQVAYARAQADQASAKIVQMEAAVRQAQLNLSYAKIYSPTSGRITRKAVVPGDYAEVGQLLFSIVPDYVYVTANFKETQLRRMRPGQPVTVRVDAYPDQRIRAHVESIQAGSGAAFSLLPPENATGNFVKIVQRVPVKIVFDERPIHVLGPGMSVAPKVKVR